MEYQHFSINVMEQIAVLTIRAWIKFLITVTDVCNGIFIGPNIFTYEYVIDIIMRGIS